MLLIIKADKSNYQGIVFSKPQVQVWKEQHPQIIQWTLQTCNDCIKKIFLTMIILLLLIKVIKIIIIIIIITVIVWKNDDDKSSKDQNNFYNDNKIICHIIYLVTSDVDSNVRTKIWRSFSSYELHSSDKMLRK